MKLFHTAPESSLLYRQFRHRAPLLIALSFLLPFLIQLLGCLAMLVTPFGKHSLAISDGQFYLNSLMHLARKLRGQENWLYTFKSGLGANAWSSLSWGGFNPVLMLALFANLETMPDWFTWISLVNLALCGVSMYLLLAGVYGHRLSHLILSTSYALIGFSVVNCYQTLFFIGVQTLPIVALGLYRLLRGENPLLYVLSLAVCIFLNFYFGFMLCVASVLLFCAYCYLHNDELRGRRWKLFGTFAICSVIAGLLAAPMWLPALKAFTGGDGRVNQTELSEFRFSENMPFLQIFSKLFSGANSTNELVSGLPNVFCGILTVALVILFFLNKRTEKRKKAAAGALLLFYLLSFYITAFTLVMHGGTHTNWFPYRYSFVFSFLLLWIAADQLVRIDELTIKDAKRCGLILLAGVLLVFSVRYEFITAGTVLLDLALLCLMWAGFRFYKTKPERTPRRLLSLFLLLVVSVNLYVNYISSIKKMQDWEMNLAEYSDNVMQTGAATQALNIAESGFFRMEKDKSESDSVGADATLYGYNGVSHSGPAERTFVHKGLNRLGINWFDMRHWYSEGVPAATDALLGLKYLISARDLEAEKGYEERLQFDAASIYLDPYALRVAILADTDAAQLTLGSDAFQNLNAVWRGMAGGEKDVFIEQADVTFTLVPQTTVQTTTSAALKTSVSNTESGIKTDEHAAAYIEYSFIAERSGPVYAFDTSIPESSQGVNSPVIKCLGVYQTGERVSGITEVSADYASGEVFRGYCAGLAIAYADNEALAGYAALLNARPTTFDPTHENDVVGSFTADEGQRLLFTIPWDEGWSLYIDGKPAAIDKTWNLFMSAQVPAGTHSYELKFFPAWMRSGLILCAAAFAGLLVLLIVRRTGRKKAAAAEIEAPAEDGTAAVDGTPAEDGTPVDKETTE